MHCAGDDVQSQPAAQSRTSSTALEALQAQNNYSNSSIHIELHPDAEATAEDKKMPHNNAADLVYSNTAPGEHDSSAATAPCHHKTAGMHHCELEASIWDAAMLLGLPSLGLSCSCLAGVILALNMAVQGAFALFVCMPELVELEYTNEAVRGLRQWRTNTAHHIDYMDPISGQSLAAR